MSSFWVEPRFSPNRLKNLRKFAGLSREDLARKSGVSYEGLARIERGDVKEPRPATLGLLSEALEVPIKAFYNE